MTWSRVLKRNNLHGDYTAPGETPDGLGAIRGDIRRLEQDQRDALHLQAYAKQAGVTVAQAKSVLDALFAGEVLACLSREEWDAWYAQAQGGEEER